MRKHLLIICCTMTLLAATSCTKQYVTPNPNQTILFTITSWALTSDSKAYATNLDIPEIDSYFQGHGGVLVYLSFDSGVTYEQVPEVYNNLSYSYTHSAGILTLYAQTADGTQPVNPPSNIQVKVVLVASN
jgi:hypothetical protein